MKTSILQENLIHPLLFVGKNISPKAQLPATQYILLTTEKGTLNLSSTNTETTTVVRIAAKSEKNGGICVPSKLFIDLITSLPTGKIEMEARGQVLFVESEGYSASLPGVGKEEFPPVPEKKKGGALFDAKEFFEAVRSVLYAAATDEGRPVLTGIKIEKTERGALFVATDGYRLSLKQTGIPFKEEFDMVIPARALSLATQLGTEEKIEFGEAEDGQAGFFAGDREIYTRAIEGEYPTYERIIPKTNTTSAVFDKEPFVKAIKTAAIFAKDNANIVRLRFEEKTVIVSANTPQVGEGKVELEVGKRGDDGDIAFNSRFLLEFLNNTEKDRLRFEMTGSLNPGVFKIDGDDSFLHIIMPVRVQAQEAPPPKD